MTDPDGLALMLWCGLGGLVMLFIALAIEAVIGRADRDWIKRLRRIETGRQQMGENR